MVSASEFQGYILGHCEIENCLHGQKDKEYGADMHVCGSSWGEAWTVLTNMAVSLTNLLQKGERTLREVMEKCCHDPLPTARKLGWKKINVSTEWANSPTRPKIQLISLAEVAALCRVGEGTIHYRLSQRRRGFSDFPLPVSKAKQKLFWDIADIENWFYNRQPPPSASDPSADEAVDRALRERHGIGA